MEEADRRGTGGGVLGVAQTAPDFAVPSGACDCHVHVFGPAARYPFWAGRTYTPPDASVENLLALQTAIGLDRVVIVHPSPYGTDNACTVDALRRLGARARGVAVIDDATPDADLRDMHAAGVRGVRLNLETAGERDPAVARRRLQATAERVAPLGWHVQVYTNLAVLAALRDAIESLPTPLVVDHCGRALGAGGTGQPGFESLVSLVRGGNVWVKLSGAYRLSEAPDFADMLPIACALIAANPEHMVWGTDWPHPGGSSGRHNPAEIEPFFAVDNGRALNRLRTWAGDATTLRRILVDNPARLYNF